LEVKIVVNESSVGGRGIDVEFCKPKINTKEVTTPSMFMFVYRGIFFSAFLALRNKHTQI
jgi:hypothetical protein